VIIKIKENHTMKINVKKSILSTAFIAGIFSICLTLNVNAAPALKTTTMAVSDTGKMSKSKMSGDKMSKGKMSSDKMSTDKMSKDKMSKGKMSKDSSKM
jgi:pentapeptide MXKDX repeat protein